MLFLPFLLLQFFFSSQATCPSGWTSGAMAGVPGCFFLNNLLTDARTWGMSERYCQQLDARGHLTFFTANSSTSTTAFVTLCKTVTSLSFGLVTVKNAIWLGGFRDPVANVIRRLNYQLFVNTIWLSGEPSGSVGNKDCVCFYMSQSGFQMCTCGTSGGYVCQISDETVPMPPSNLKYTANRVTSASPACPSNWVLIGKLYYQTPPSVLYPSVSAAAAACASLDARATLPYFTDATQWEAFLAVISTWQVVDNRNITIGARQVQPGVYQMLDGAWLYSDWYTFGGQPSTIAGMDCVTMRDIDGYQWRSIDCNNTPVYTICQLNCTVTATTTVTSTTSTTMLTSTSTTRLGTNGTSVTSRATTAVPTMKSSATTLTTQTSTTTPTSTFKSSLATNGASVNSASVAVTTVSTAVQNSTFSTGQSTNGTTSTANGYTIKTQTPTASRTSTTTGTTISSTFNSKSTTGAISTASASSTMKIMPTSTPTIVATGGTSVSSGTAWSLSTVTNATTTSAYTIQPQTLPGSTTPSTSATTKSATSAISISSTPSNVSSSTPTKVTIASTTVSSGTTWILSTVTNGTSTMSTTAGSTSPTWTFSTRQASKGAMTSGQTVQLQTLSASVTSTAAAAANTTSSMLNSKSANVSSTTKTISTSTSAAVATVSSGSSSVTNGTSMSSAYGSISTIPTTTSTKAGSGSPTWTSSTGYGNNVTMTTNSSKNMSTVVVPVTISNAKPSLSTLNLQSKISIVSLTMSTQNFSVYTSGTASITSTTPTFSPGLTTIQSSWIPVQNYPSTSPTQTSSTFSTFNSSYKSPTVTTSPSYLITSTTSTGTLSRASSYKMTQGLVFITIRGTNGTSVNSGYKRMTTLLSSNLTTNQTSTGSLKSISVVILANASLTSTMRPQSASVVVRGLPTSSPVSYTSSRYGSYSKIVINSTTSRSTLSSTFSSILSSRQSQTAVVITNSSTQLSDAGLTTSRPPAVLAPSSTVFTSLVSVPNVQSSKVPKIDISPDYSSTLLTFTKNSQSTAPRITATTLYSPWPPNSASYPSSSSSLNLLPTTSAEQLQSTELLSTSVAGPAYSSQSASSSSPGDDEIIIDYTIPDDVDSLSQQMETTTGDNMDYAQLTSAVTTSTTLGIQGMTEDMDYEYTTLAIPKDARSRNSDSQYSKVSEQIPKIANFRKSNLYNGDWA